VSVPGTGVSFGPKTISLVPSNPCNSLPAINFTVNVNTFAGVDAGEDFSLCLGEDTELTNNLLGNAASIEKWEIIAGPNGTTDLGEISGGNIVDNVQEPYIFTPNSEGTYRLKTTTNKADGSCTASQTGT